MVQGPYLGDYLSHPESKVRQGQSSQQPPLEVVTTGQRANTKKLRTEGPTGGPFCNQPAE